MKFDDLNEMIPYAKGGKEKILTMQPYDNITLKLPGRHQKDTVPVGGDFVVCVTDPWMHWEQHQFTHDDLFYQFEYKKHAWPDMTQNLTGLYLEVVRGENPSIMRLPGAKRDVGINYRTLLFALQCLAVAEHRRYWQHEETFGGRYLPYRYTTGIVEDLWTAEDAVKEARWGKPGVLRLEKRGVPVLTKKLMETDE